MGRLTVGVQVLAGIGGGGCMLWGGGGGGEWLSVSPDCCCMKCNWLRLQSFYSPGN